MRPDVERALPFRNGDFIGSARKPTRVKVETHHSFFFLPVHLHDADTASRLTVAPDDIVRPVGVACQLCVANVSDIMVFRVGPRFVCLIAVHIQMTMPLPSARR